MTELVGLAYKKNKDTQGKCCFKKIVVMWTLGGRRAQWPMLTQLFASLAKTTTIVMNVTNMEHLKH